MKTLHVVPGLDDPFNGIARAAKLIARAQGAALADARDFARGRVDFRDCGEVWVHSGWLPSVMMSCWRVVRSGKPLVRMTHANLDPLRLGTKRLKKFLVSGIERWLFRRTSRVVVTCAAEREWCEGWGLRGSFEELDLKRFFDFSRPVEFPRGGAPLRILYLGRRHALKGLDYLQRAVWELNAERGGAAARCELRAVSHATGAALESAWEWAGALCLPTLSENFGLVVAEALERGKPVIGTDGAPAWADLAPERGAYLRGYRGGDDAARVALLKAALKRFADGEDIGK